MNNHSIDDFCAIAVMGAQAESFLQGQFTCDVKTLQPGQAILGACCDHKGRMLFNGWVGRGQENYILYLPKNMRDMSIAHLQKFAVFSKVTLTEKTDWTGLIYLATSLPALPTQDLIQGKLPLHHPHPGDCLHWLIGPSESLQTIRSTLAATMQPIEPAALPLLMILAQLVFIQPATQELFIPQMIGLEKQGGVSFTKGCYVGQEVVARTQHLGQLKRHLQILQMRDGPAPQIGESLFDDKNEIIGQIAAVSIDPADGYRLLAVIQDRALSNPIFSAQQIELRSFPSLKKGD